MTRTLSLVAAALFAATTLVAQEGAAASNPWHADFDVAVAKAKELKKDLLVDFTGSDWCGWCMKLDKEVFSHDEFLTEIKKDYVLLALDYPHGDEAKKKVPNEKRNAELQQLHGIQGFPTILLMNSDGVVYGQTGYQAGGPEKYVEHVKGLRTKGRASLDRYQGLADAWKKAKDAAKGAAWDEVVKTFEAERGDSRAATLLVPTIREALTFDPTNAQGRKLRAMQVLVSAGLADDGLLTEARTLDPKNEKGLLERVVLAQFEKVRSPDAARAAVAELDALVALGARKDKKTDFLLHLNAAWLCNGALSDAERAKKYAKTAKDVGTDDARLSQILEQILNG